MFEIQQGWTWELVRNTRNDIFRDISCLIASPIYYSFIYKSCRSDECRHALLFLLLEVISFVLDLMGGSHWGFLLASFLLSAFNFLIIIYTFYHQEIENQIGSQSERYYNGNCLLWLPVDYLLINYSASVFPLAYAIISVLFAFKNSKGISNSPSNTSTNSSTDQIVKVEYTYQLQLNDIQVNPPDTPTDQIGDVDDTKTSQLSNICDVEPSKKQPNEVQQDFVPSSSHFNKVQQVPNMLRKRRNTFMQFDQGEENEV
ncbi:hypothetical protein ACOSQ4_004122 [Xanthoceras sorbifolium]